VTGRITRSLVVRQGRRSASYFIPIVAYEYQVGGQRYVGRRVSFADEDYSERAQAEQVVARFPKHASVTVRYRDANPATAVLDSRRPPLVSFVQALALLAAAAFLSFGFVVVRGAISDPPKYAAGDAPSVARQLGGALLAIGAACALTAGVRALLELDRRRRLARIQGAQATPIASVREGQRVALFGRAERAGGEVVEPTFGDRPVVYDCVRVRAEGGEVLERTSAGAVRLSDESGSLLVLTEDANDELVPRVLPDDESVTAWVDHELEQPRAHYTVEHRTIAEGAQMLAIGVVAHDRERGELVLRAQLKDPDLPDPNEPGALIVSDQTRDELVRRLRRGMGRTLLIAVVAAASLLAGGTLLSSSP
jgi:hypothetical protein